MARFSPEYLDYMESPEWQETREWKLREAGWKCERCLRGRDDGVTLQVHHWTYENLGAELREDLEVLCEVHHAQADEARRAGYGRYEWIPGDVIPASGVRRTLRKVSKSEQEPYRYKISRDDDGTYRVGIVFMRSESVAADGILDPAMAQGLADRLRDGQVMIADLDIIRATTKRAEIPGL